MTGLRRAVAIIFRRKGAAITAADFRHVASFDFKWFSPKEAARLLDLARSAGLVKEEGERIRATFDVHKEAVPVDFRPGPELFDEVVESYAEGPPTEEPPLVERLAVAASTVPDELAALARTERERAQSLITEETALLLAARRKGADVAAFVR